MSEYEQVIDEIVKRGVAVKVNKIVDENYIPYEIKYAGCVVELDFTEHDKVFKNKIEQLDDKIKSLESKCADRKEQVECLKKMNDELKSKETLELPFDPLECANYLINATYERKTSSFERTFSKVPDKVNSDIYTVDDLEQIAEHLLVYCKHNKELR